MSIEQDERWDLPAHTSVHQSIIPECMVIISQDYLDQIVVGTRCVQRVLDLLKLEKGE